MLSHPTVKVNGELSQSNPDHKELSNVSTLQVKNLYLLGSEGSQNTEGLLEYSSYIYS